MHLAKRAATHRTEVRASRHVATLYDATETRITSKRCSLRPALSASVPRTAPAHVPRGDVVPPKISLVTSRSNLLRLSFLAVVGANAGYVAPGSAAAVRSLEFGQPATLTIHNDGSRTVKIYWLNYDGDQELFAYVQPLASWTVDTYSSHPWRVADAETGVVLKEVIAGAGAQTVEVTGKEKPLRPEAGAFNGFDGVGGQPGDYVQATLGTLYVAYDGGAVTLDLTGFKHPLEIPLASPQLVGMVEAAAGEMRRPSLLQSWQRTLLAAGAEVERVIVTRVVPPFFYTRIVLKLRDGHSMSIDAQPGDSIALAQQTGCPLFVASDIASLVNKLAEEATANDALRSLVPGSAPRQVPLLPKSPSVPALPAFGAPGSSAAAGPYAREGYAAPFAGLLPDGALSGASGQIMQL